MLQGLLLDLILIRKNQLDFVGLRDLLAPFGRFRICQLTDWIIRLGSRLRGGFLRLLLALGRLLPSLPLLRLALRKLAVFVEYLPERVLCGP